MVDQADMSQSEEYLKEALKSGNTPLIAEIVEEYLDKKDLVPLNIAVTGECGSGKSTFVNAFRGVDNKDEGAAATGCVETTKKPETYSYPKHPHVTLWDLPGIGTTEFPAHQYLEQVEFKKYDFFIIMSDTRFAENDAKLAQEIQKMRKKLYFVRTKIDNDLRSEERSQRNFNEETTLDRIRKNCIEGLEKLQIPSPKVFLISSFDLNLYDFENLWNTLEKELPQHQKDVLLLALPTISQEVCKKKKEVLQAQIKCYALISAVGAAVPVPVLSVAVDSNLILKFVRKCEDVFHIGAVEVFDSYLKEPVKPGILLSVDLILRVLSTSMGFASLTVAEEASRLTLVLGIPIAMGLSSITTYKALTFFLEAFEKAALNAVMKAISSTQV